MVITVRNRLRDFYLASYPVPLYPEAVSGRGNGNRNRLSGDPPKSTKQDNQEYFHGLKFGVNPAFNYISAIHDKIVKVVFQAATSQSFKAYSRTAIRQN